MTGRLGVLLRRFERVLRYIAAGAGVTFFYSLLTIALVATRVIEDPTVASVIASVVTVPVSFFVHRAVTYIDVPFDAAHWRRFAITAMCSLVIAASAMKTVDLMRWPYGVGLAIGWVLIPIVNYTINAIWVFRAKTFLALDSKQRATVSDDDAGRSG